MKSIMFINIASIALGVVASLSSRGPDYPRGRKITALGLIQVTQAAKKISFLSSLGVGVSLAGRILLDHLGIGTEK